MAARITREEILKRLKLEALSAERQEAALAQISGMAEKQMLELAYEALSEEDTQELNGMLDRDASFETVDAWLQQRGIDLREVYDAAVRDYVDSAAGLVDEVMAAK